MGTQVSGGTYFLFLCFCFVFFVFILEKKNWKQARIVHFDLLFPMVFSTAKFDARTPNESLLRSTDLAVKDT